MTPFNSQGWSGETQNMQERLQIWHRTLHWTILDLVRTCFVIFIFYFASLCFLFVCLFVFLFGSCISCNSCCLFGSATFQIDDFLHCRSIEELTTERILQIIEEFVQSHQRYMWFINDPHLRSVRGLFHVHFFVTEK
jgi:hypothetical protein